MAVNTEFGQWDLRVEFLLESGFKRYCENWIAEDISLGVLAKGEYEVVRWL